MTEFLHAVKTRKQAVNAPAKSSLKGVIIFNEALICSYINAAVTQMFLFSEEDLVGTTAEHLVAPEDRLIVKENALCQMVEPYEVTLLRQDGSRFPGMIHGETIVIGEQKLRITTVRDMSDCKIVEKQLKRKSKEYESIFHNSLVGIALLDKNRKIVRANNTAAGIVGYESSEQVIGKDILEFHTSKENYVQFTKMYKEALFQSNQFKNEVQLRRKDGSPIWVNLSGSLLSTKVPPSLEEGIVWIVDDISEEKKNKTKMEQAFEELETIFNNALTGILVVKGDRVIHKVNQAFVDIMGRNSPEDWVGKSVREFHLSDQAFDEFGDKFYNPLIQKEVVEIDYQIKGRNGESRWAAISGKAIDKNIPADLNKGVIWVAIDITQRKKAEEELLKMARIDSLTGICNRRYFFENAKREINVMNRHATKLSLLMLDIDHFKKINDTFGHCIGDKALRLFADVCSSQIRNIDFIGRLGGEEFGILLLDTDLQKGLQVTDRIQNALKTATQNHDSIPPMTVSIGLVQIGDKETLDTALKRADVLMYNVKKSGRNRVEC